MHLYGNYADARRLGTTLVKLLEEGDAKVRSAAFAVLLKAVPDGLGYSPAASAAAKQDAVARWQRWCAEKCGPEEPRKR
jgi:hypothetical protein